MARAARNSKKKSSNPRVNFDGVETISVVPEGEYITSVADVKLEESKEGNDYLAWQLAITGGKHKGKKLFHNTSLAEQSLWATKRFLENLGVAVEDGEMELELDDYKEMEIGVVVEHETYKGRTRSRIVDTFPAEDEGSEKGDKDDEDGETYTEEAVNEMGKKDLKALVAKHELDVELDGSAASQRRAVIKALKAEDLISDGEEEEKPKKGAKGKKVEDEDDDEKPAKGRKSKKTDDEEEEKPARGRRGRKAKDDDDEEEKPKKGKKSKKVAADDVNSMDEEGLGELIETHELDVDLDDHSTMKRKRSAVIDALESADLLED